MNGRRFARVAAVKGRDTVGVVIWYDGDRCLARCALGSCASLSCTVCGRGGNCDERNRQNFSLTTSGMGGPLIPEPAVEKEGLRVIFFSWPNWENAIHQRARRPRSPPPTTAKKKPSTTTARGICFLNIVRPVARTMDDPERDPAPRPAILRGMGNNVTLVVSVAAGSVPLDSQTPSD